MKTTISNICFLFCVFLSTACQSTKNSSREKDSSRSISEEENTRQKSARQKAAPEKVTAPEKAVVPSLKGGSTQVQSSVRFVTTTFANEETFAGQIPQPKLEDILRELEEMVRERNDDGGALISYLVFRRLSGADRDFLGVLEKRGSTASSRDPWILIECAYSALLRRDYGMAQYLLDTAENVGKGKDKVATAVLHARGLMFFSEKKTVLAMAAFRDAAKQNYEPSILTLTFFALRAGDHEGALIQLNRLKDSGAGNLDVKAALGIAYRLAGKPEEAVESLRGVQRARPNDRRTLWNYALALSQVPGKRKEAIAVLEKYNDSPGGSLEFDSRARNLLGKLQNLEEAAARQQVEQVRDSKGAEKTSSEGQESKASDGKSQP